MLVCQVLQLSSAVFSSVEATLAPPNLQTHSKGLSPANRTSVQEAYRVEGSGRRGFLVTGKGFPSRTVQIRGQEGNYFKLDSAFLHKGTETPWPINGRTASGAKQRCKTRPWLGKHRSLQVLKTVTRVKSFGKPFGYILCISIPNLKYTSDCKEPPGTFYTKGPSIKTLASISSISCTVSQKTVTLLKEKSISYCYPL